MKSLIIALVLLMIASHAYALTTTWGWGYDNETEPAVVGFRVYKNGGLIHTVNDAAARQCTIDVDQPVLGDRFTLTAFTNDEESAHTAPYIWTGGVVIVTFKPRVWFAKPSHKKVRVGGPGLTGARIR